MMVVTVITTIIITIIMKTYGCKRGAVLEWSGEEDWNMLCEYVQREPNESTKHCLKAGRRSGWEYNGEGGLVQSTLHACI
jgi:hypothetical protein